MPHGKASGPDGISVETLKAGGASLDQQLARLYTKCLKENLSLSLNVPYPAGRWLS